MLIESDAAAAPSQAVDPRRGTGPRARRGVSLGVVTLPVLVALAALLSLAVGAQGIAPTRVLDVLFHPDGSQASAIVHGLRVPRTALAVSVGACLGVAGALMQGHTRNPLADPGLLGVSFGASFAVVLGIALLDVTTAGSYVWLALVGAGLASVAVFAIGSTRSGPSPVTLVLAGTAISALLSALTQGVVLNDATTLDRYRFWAVGSVAGRPIDVFWQVLPFMLLGGVLAAVSTAGLNLLQLGDDVARSLGISPWRHKAMGIGAVMLLTGAATAACGPIAFIGLVVPHVARWAGGADYRWVVPYSALVGALLLTLADIVGRVIAPPAEVQVGIVMALIGGPVFIALVRRMRRVSL